MFRNVLAVIVGYVIFTAMVVLFFQLSGVNPELSPSMNDVILTLFISGIGSIICGYVTVLISKSGTKKVLYGLCGIIIVVSVVSMFLQPEANKWTQISTIFILVPLVYIGGCLRLNFASKK